MSEVRRTVSVTLPVTGIHQCVEDSDWVCCLGCGTHLGLTQPESTEPERLIGTCADCGRWYLLDWHPGAGRGHMVLLPEHEELRSLLGEES